MYGAVNRRAFGLGLGVDGAGGGFGAGLGASALGINLLSAPRPLFFFGSLGGLGAEGLAGPWF